MRRTLIAIGAVLLASCSSPTPSPSTLPAATAPPPNVTVTPIPTPAPPPLPVRGPQFSQIFWDEFVHNSYEQPNALQPLQRLTAAPMLYLKTVDEAGQPIDTFTLQTVEDAMRAVAPTWGGGQFALAGVERGTSTREGQRGWLTVKWPNPSIGDLCGFAQIAVDGGWIELNYLRASGCGCGGSRMWARAAGHELGHAFGYRHTDSGNDLMSTGFQISTCNQLPSPREIYHAQLAYQSPVGTVTALPVLGVSSIVID